METSASASRVGIAEWQINGFTLDLTFSEAETTDPDRRMELFLTTHSREDVSVTGRTHDVKMDLGRYVQRAGKWVFVPDTACLIEPHAVEAIAIRIDNWLG